MVDLLPIHRQEKLVTGLSCGRTFLVLRAEASEGERGYFRGDQCRRVAGRRIGLLHPVVVPVLRALVPRSNGLHASELVAVRLAPGHRRYDRRTVTTPGGEGRDGRSAPVVAAGLDRASSGTVSVTSTNADHGVRPVLP